MARMSFAPTPEQLEQAAAILRDGGSFSVVAEAVGISSPTARKVFGHLKPEAPGPAVMPSLFGAAADILPAGQADAPSPVAQRDPLPIFPSDRPRTGKRRGRPPVRVTQSDRDKVELYVAAGWKVPEIATVLGLSEPTVRRLFKRELQVGLVRQKARVLDNLNKAASKGNVRAMEKLLDHFSRGEAEAATADLRRGAGRDGEGDEAGSQTDHSSAPVPSSSVGKKEQQVIDAMRVVGPDNPTWGDLLAPRTETTTH